MSAARVSVRGEAAADEDVAAGADNAGYPAPVHQQALAEHGPTPYHRLSWAYLDDLPQWRHLRIHRPAVDGQLTLI